MCKNDVSIDYCNAKDFARFSYCLNKYINPMQYVVQVHVRLQKIDTVVINRLIDV